MKGLLCGGCIILKADPLANSLDSTVTPKMLGEDAEVVKFFLAPNYWVLVLSLGQLAIGDHIFNVGWK